MDKPEYIKEAREIEVLSNQDLTKTNIISKQQITKYWDRDYIDSHIENIENLSHQMLMRFLWMSGVRISEAINLRKSDIDFMNYVMTVKWLKSRKYQYRVVPIHPRLKDILQIYIASMKSEDLVFNISRQRAWQLCKKYMKGNPHRFRHSFAVNWLRCGGDLVVLHKILGHSKIQTTMEYLKIVPIDQGKELIKIIF